MIHLSSDYSEIDAELDRLTRMPTAKAKHLLDWVLSTGFKLTQAAVHVETGALKASGTKESSVNRIFQVWEGEITYGSPGGSPVDYAIYEKARGIGGAGGPSDAYGDHNFMAPLHSLDPEFRAALKAALRP